MQTATKISVGILAALAIAIPAAKAFDAIQVRQGGKGGTLQGQGFSEAQNQNRQQHRYQHRHSGSGAYGGSYGGGQSPRGAGLNSYDARGVSGRPAYGQPRGYAGQQGYAQGSVGNRGGGQGGRRGR
jgi:hypothetical protein